MPVSFNQEGLDLKREMLNQLSPSEFNEQMELIQNDTRTWCINNFVLNDNQIEYLNGMPDLLVQEIGLQARIVIQLNKPLILEVPDWSTITDRAAKPCKCKVKGGGTYTPHTGEFEWKLTLGFSFP